VVAWRRTNAGHVSLGQLQAMSAIVTCRTAALARHALRGLRAHPDRLQLLPQPPLPEVSGSRRTRLAGRARSRSPDLPYFHVVFTLPAAIADLAYQNKAVIYDLEAC
jgi:hypothetical protein